MTQVYAELGEDLARQQYNAVARTLQRIANQPGFHGVRMQSTDLFAHATNRGYDGLLPTLFSVQKVPRGKSLLIAQSDRREAATTSSAVG